MVSFSKSTFKFLISSLYLYFSWCAYTWRFNQLLKRLCPRRKELCILHPDYTHNSNYQTSCPAKSTVCIICRTTKNMYKRQFPETLSWRTNGCKLVDGTVIEGKAPQLNQDQSLLIQIENRLCYDWSEIPCQLPQTVH